MVNSVRQQQKNDKNDALAIVQASLLPGVKFIQGKTIPQQQLQSLMRLRDLSVKQKTATKNQLKALLSEFNIRVSNLSRTIQDLLEDAENGYSPYFRKAISTVWKTYLQLTQAVKEYDNCIQKAIRTSAECKKLTSLEGVGPINAINLYLAIGCSQSTVFNDGKGVSACIGLTPVQHSSGGGEEIVDSHKLILVISIRYDKALNNAAAITSPLSFSESITDFSK